LLFLSVYRFACLRVIPFLAPLTKSWLAVQRFASLMTIPATASPNPPSLASISRRTWPRFDARLLGIQPPAFPPLAVQTPDGDITISASSLLSAASCLGLRVSRGLVIRPATKNHSIPPRFTPPATSNKNPTVFAAQTPLAVSATFAVFRPREHRLCSRKQRSVP